MRPININQSSIEKLLEAGAIDMLIGGARPRDISGVIMAKRRDLKHSSGR